MATRTAAELVEFMAKAIVGEPTAVKVRDTDSSIELETAEGDRGRVIGRQGRVAKTCGPCFRGVAGRRQCATRHRRLSRGSGRHVTDDDRADPSRGSRRRS